MLAVFAILLRLGLGVAHALAAGDLPPEQRSLAVDIAAATCLAAAPVSQSADPERDERPAGSGPVCPVCFGGPGHLAALLPELTAFGCPFALHQVVFSPTRTDPALAGPSVEGPRPRAPPVSA